MDDSTTAPGSEQQATSVRSTRAPAASVILSATRDPCFRRQPWAEAMVNLKNRKSQIDIHTPNMSELPPDPKAAKNLEKQIAKEAKADEKSYQNALKELKNTEKSEAKASKTARKAEQTLRKIENKEHDAIKTLQKATHQHDLVVTNLHSAQSDLQIKQQHTLRLRQNADQLRSRADQLSKDKQAHEKERDTKLADIRSGAGTSAGATTGR